MIGNGDDVYFCMDYFPNIIIRLRVRSGPYLGGATRMVCEMQPVLQPLRCRTPLSDLQITDPSLNSLRFESSNALF
ncbi:hypothetical protein HanRHA438_Chr03g0112521 [Helianthus annuus]|nr:hypothetical protein HanHA300_Chr03g0084761 [Helianthus annuus]KAJ0934870.1 hypothetical protein HanRHA438_Chr03g0112521 [Helianthus annuus]